MPLPVQDHYEIARERAAARLEGRLEPGRLSLLGADRSPDGGAVVLPCLCWEFGINPSDWTVSMLPERSAVAVIWQILALDYLGAPQPRPPRSFVSFADIAEGRGYQDAFESRVVGRLSRRAGRTRDGLVEAVERLGGVPGGEGPLRCMLRFFPLLEFQVVRYEGDEDVAPSCSVLLPDNLLSLFTLEDGIVAAERLVAALEGKTPAAAPRGAP